MAIAFRVRVECVSCGEVQEIHVPGGWDIGDVQHTCGESVLLLGDTVKPQNAIVPRRERRGEWKIQFSPSRAFI